jgi:hypothetical protein
MALVAAVALAAAASILLVRRRAPSGSVFVDSDRAAGVFGVLGGAFAIILAIVVLP